mgnify:CR=1 FL=1
MTCKVDVLKNNQFQTSEWSGGTTTQIAIYPEDAVYNERNFIWRISSAKVEVEESTFTHLPGINRIIMVLEGELELIHEGHHRCKLQAFEQDRFNGSWNTKSYGKVVDFNLMMNENAIGNLENIFIEKNQGKKFVLSGIEKPYSKNTHLIYCASGDIRVHIPDDENTLSLYEGEAIILTTREAGPTEFILSNVQENMAKLVKVNIMY